MEHARPVRSGPLRDEERAVPQLFVIDARPFGLRDLGRLAADHVEDGEKVFVAHDPAVWELCEGCDRVNGRVHDELGPQLRSNVARHARDDYDVREKIPQPDEIRLVHSAPRAEHRFADPRMTDLAGPDERDSVRRGSGDDALRGFRDRLRISETVLKGDEDRSVGERM